MVQVGGHYLPEGVRMQVDIKFESKFSNFGSQGPSKTIQARMGSEARRVAREVARDVQTILNQTLETKFAQHRLDDFTSRFRLALRAKPGYAEGGDIPFIVWGFMPEMVPTAVVENTSVRSLYAYLGALEYGWAQPDFGEGATSVPWRRIWYWVQNSNFRGPKTKRIAYRIAMGLGGKTMPGLNIIGSVRRNSAYVDAVGRRAHTVTLDSLRGVLQDAPPRVRTFKSSGLPGS